MLLLDIPSSRVGKNQCLKRKRKKKHGSLGLNQGFFSFKPWIVFFLVYLFLLFYLYFYNSVYEFHIQYKFLSVSRRVNKHLNIFHNLNTKNKKKKNTSTRWPRRSDEVYVKSRESQKNYKDNEVITITITRVCVCARVESCDETCTHTHTHSHRHTSLFLRFVHYSGILPD